MQTTITRLDWYNKALSHVGDYVATVNSNNTANTVYTTTHTLMKLCLPKVFNSRLTCNITERVNGTITLLNDVYSFDLTTTTTLPQEIYLVKDILSGRAINFSNLNSRRPDGLVSYSLDSRSLQIGKPFIEKQGILPINVSILYSSKPNFELPLTTSYTFADELVDLLSLCVASRLAVVLEGNAQLAQILDALYKETMSDVQRTYGFSHQRSYFIG